MFRTLVYPKLWHIQNQKRFQNPGLFRALLFRTRGILIYDEALCETAIMAIIIFESYNYFRNINFSCRIVLVHDTRSNDSQSKDARFMHKLFKNAYFI